MYLDVIDSNGKLLRFFVNGSAMFILNGKLNFQCTVLNVVMDEAVTHIYLLGPLG